MGQARDVLDRMTTLTVEARDVEAAAECYADNAVVMTPDAGEVRGREQIADYWRHFIEAFSDSHFDSLGKHETGNAAIDEGYFTGTNTAPMKMPTGDTLPATGKHVRVRSCDIVTVENGKIIEHHLYFDQADFLGQLGLSP